MYVRLTLLLNRTLTSTKVRTGNIYPYERKAERANFFPSFLDADQFDHEFWPTAAIRLRVIKHKLSSFFFQSWLRLLKETIWFEFYSDDEVVKIDDN